MALSACYVPSAVHGHSGMQQAQILTMAYALGSPSSHASGKEKDSEGGSEEKMNGMEEDTMDQWMGKRHG